ncbi:hypothetical protein EST62_01570 [Chlorobaculum sp. 24CR]|uniref:hypothetical protein n=1 Tax=Chlorobaculum sp. 24CR TaxID=2508878 RepID=UPI00100A38AF|nr:hypothetical protein [Chlorobaculum sp. 24CR]RXK88786.1 hypothetical protein EST62_01570 [Chlorobaculum sp. 24CR]
MPDNKKPINEGWKPEKIDKGYQPAKPKEVPIGDSKPLGGYQPTTSSGEGSIKKPIPPGDE